MSAVDVGVFGWWVGPGQPDVEVGQLGRAACGNGAVVHRPPVGEDLLGQAGVLGGETEEYGQTFVWIMIEQGGGGAPEELVLSDRVLLLLGVLWALLFGIAVMGS